MKRFLLLFSLVILIFTSCQTKYLSTKQKISTIKKLDCLLGTWTTYSMVYTVIETWKKVNDTTLTGKSIMIMSGDTVLNGRMSIQPAKNYINMNSRNLAMADAEIENFKLIKLTSDKLIFEKVTGGKPENITYHFISPETMRILIKTDGKSVESYNMKKFIKR